MKKIFSVLIITLMFFIILNCFKIEGQSNDSYYEISEEGYRIFDNLYERDKVINFGGMYVDFMNTKDKEVMDVFGRTVEIDFITHSLRNLSEQMRNDLKYEASKILNKSEINEVFGLVDSNSVVFDLKIQEQYADLLTENFVDLLIEKYQTDVVFDDRIDVPQNKGNTTYHWYPTYFGNRHYYDSNYTYYGNYYQYNQYYKKYIESEILPWNTERTSTKDILYESSAIPYGNKLGETTSYIKSKQYDFYDTATLRYYVYKPGFLGIGKKHEIYNLYKEVTEYSRVYTGVYYYGIAGNPQRYAHPQKIVFTYQSYNILGVHAPEASITLIKDYFGDQKMILVSIDPEIGVYSFYITQEVHYNRNKWYQMGDYQIPLTSYYPTLGSVHNSGAPWKEASPTASYFHKLLYNQSNVKYILPVVYYDGTAGVLTSGEFELVYSGETNQSPVVTDPFLEGTFNFGCVNNFASGTGIVNDSHYIRDVYPYLIWGNSLSDYQNHTPFERFVWDKDSANILNYKGRNLFGFQLTSLYPGTIGNQGGTAIPESVQNGGVLF